jgi:hypothetical protein
MESQYSSTSITVKQIVQAFVYKGAAGEVAIDRGSMVRYAQKDFRRDFLVNVTKVLLLLGLVGKRNWLKIGVTKQRLLSNPPKPLECNISA